MKAIVEQILLNLNTAGKVRRVQRNGRSYLVAPTTILVPGVLAGSEGPLFYPPSEIAANPGVWNDTPIVVYHPTENGRNVAARKPQVLDKFKIGRVYNDTVTKKGTRRVEAWFDEERTKTVDNRVYKALIKGQPLELSTGLYTKNDYQDGTYKGKGYTAIARNYQPDHLAILPDQVGACLLPGQKIQGRFVRGSKAWYTGEAVRLETASGEVLSVTTNHPVLTRKGFVPAGEITEGQYLLHYIGKDKSSLSDVDEKNAPALVEDVFDSLKSMFGVQSLCHALPLDFHGDAEFFKSNVEIVGAKRSLVNALKPGFSQSPQQGDFGRGRDLQSGLFDQSDATLHFRSVATYSEFLLLLSGEPGIHCLGSLGSCSGQATFLERSVENYGQNTEPSTSFVNGFSSNVRSDSFFDHCWGRSFIDDPLLPALCVIGPGAELDVSLSERASNGSNVNLVEDRQFLDGHSGFITRNPVSNHAVSNDCLSDWDVPVSQPTVNRPNADTELFRQLLDRFPRKVLKDKVVNVDRFFHDGPVYDFETTTGYMVAEGLLISNCSIQDGCGVLNYYKKEWVSLNSFCPTGPGGGVNPSCSPQDTGFASKHNPAVKYKQESDRNSDDSHFDRQVDKLSKTQQEVRALKEKIAKVDAAHKRTVTDKTSSLQAVQADVRATDKQLGEIRSARTASQTRIAELKAKLRKNALVTDTWTPLANKGYSEQTAPVKKCKCKPDQKDKCAECSKMHADTTAVVNALMEDWTPLLNYDKSYEDKRSDLTSQLVERFASKSKVPMDGMPTYSSGPDLVDLYDDYLVYSFGGQLYRLDYTEDKSGCTLSKDAPVEVRRVTSYEPISNAATLPSSQLDVTPEKACQIIKDGTVHGKHLSKSQRGLFGVRCGQRSPNPTHNASALADAWLPL